MENSLEFALTLAGYGLMIIGGTPLALWLDKRFFNSNLF